MWRVARVRSVRLRVTGVNDSIEKGLIGPAGVRRRAGGGAPAGRDRRDSRHNARERRLLRPKRMGAAAGATGTHGSAGGFRRFLAFGRIIGRNARKRRDRPALTCVSAIWAALSCVSAIRPALTCVLANRPVRSAEQSGSRGTTSGPHLLLDAPFPPVAGSGLLYICGTQSPTHHSGDARRPDGGRVTRRPGSARASPAVNARPRSPPARDR